PFHCDVHTMYTRCMSEESTEEQKHREENTRKLRAFCEREFKKRFGAAWRNTWTKNFHELAVAWEANNKDAKRIEGELARLLSAAEQVVSRALTATGATVQKGDLPVSALDEFSLLQLAFFLEGQEALKTLRKHQ